MQRKKSVMNLVNTQQQKMKNPTQLIYIFIINVKKHSYNVAYNSPIHHNHKLHFIHFDKNKIKHYILTIQYK